jgi:hypothetical protein
MGPKLRKCNGWYCVGSFHGHAHCRVCQLDWHPLYIDGCGLEDFKTCERIFSRSNALATCTCHASAFHRKQLVIWWFDTWNADKYADSSQFPFSIILALSEKIRTGKFMYNNYIQALENLASIPEQLNEAMRVLEIPSVATFKARQLKERHIFRALRGNLKAKCSLWNMLRLL